MAIEIKVANKITVKQFRNLSAEFALDLEALFSYYENQMNLLLEKARNDEWDFDRLISEIDNLTGVE